MKKVFLLGLCCFLVSHLFSEVELSSDGKVRYYEADEEVFFVNDSSNSTLRITKGRMEQKSYDKDQKLLETVTWSDDSTIIEKIKEYTYFDNSVVVESIISDNFVTNKRIIEFYNTQGKLIEEKSFLIVEDNYDLEFTKKYTYNSDKKIKSILLTYSDPAIPVEKTEYVYKKNITQPNTFVYRDSALQKSIEYTSKEEYTETVYFSDAMSIVTEYEKGIPIKEEVYKNGKKLRESQL